MSWLARGCKGDRGLLEMRIAIGTIALIFFSLSIIGSIYCNSIKEYDRQHWEECFAIAYLTISVWCFS